jgi:H+/Cl- antiporter ClcA/CBS domain-containing protein
MAGGEVEKASTTDGLPVAPSLAPALVWTGVPPRPRPVDRRVVVMSAVAIALAVAAALVAEGLVRLIALFTNLSFHGQLSAVSAEPTLETLGMLVVCVPVLGGVVVGLMARYGSSAIRGHGIPEAMEQILVNQSRVPPRMLFLKPLSAAVAIGTGGPFGAEGPIIATGGALGSFVGQVITTTTVERKTLLAAGAAAGMAATFGSPVAAVLLAVELLLFEFRPRSLIPVALASVTAAATHMVFHGVAPMFAMPDLAQPSGTAMAVYVGLGALIGLAAVGVTRAVYAVEDAFARLPIHWMWWPALGGVAVGFVGYVDPRSLGVGYRNIADVLSGQLTAQAVGLLATAKFVSWVIALGSGTSGGTLAPLFTVGGGLGALLGTAAAHALPHAGIDPRIGALVGMAAIFAGASRALLASVVFAFETTLQPLGLLPLLGGCTASFLVSSLLMRHSIMTEKIARRGVRVPAEYAPDFLDQLLVRDMSSREVVSLRASDRVGEVRAWIEARSRGASHQGFPVLDEAGALVGVTTRRDILDPQVPADILVGTLVRRPPVFVHDDSTLREAADLMVDHDIGRLPVTARSAPRTVVGMITRSDLLRAHRRRLDEHNRRHPGVRRRLRRSVPVDSIDRRIEAL